MKSLFIVALSLFVGFGSSQCPASSQLQGIFEITQNLILDRNQTQNFNISLPEVPATATPVIAINAYECLIDKILQFQIFKQFQPPTLAFMFLRNQNAWLSVSLRIWMVWHPGFTINIIDFNEFTQKKTTNIKLNPPNSQKVYSFVNFITGFMAKSQTGQFQVATTYINETLTLLWQSTQITFIQISYIFVLKELVVVNQGVISIIQGNNTNPLLFQYPQFHHLFGLQAFSFSSGNLTLSFSIDDLGFKFSSSNQANYSISFVTISRQPLLACSKCQFSVLYKQQCIEKCPEKTVLAESKQGKWCVQCQNSQCLCGSQFIKTQDKCLSKNIVQQLSLIDDTPTLLIEDITPTNSLSDSTCLQNQKVVNGKCVCDDKSIKNEEGKCLKCEIGFFKSENSCKPLSCKLNEMIQNNECVCNERSVKFNEQCIQCPSVTYKNKNTQQCLPCPDNCLSCLNPEHCLSCRGNQQLDSFNKCVCQPPNLKIADFCQPCPTSLVYSPTQQTCILPAKQCPNNMIIVNNECVCDQFSIPFTGNTCFKCARGSFKNQTICSSCLAPCLSCTSSTNCQACQTNFLLQRGSCLCLPPQVLIEGKCITSFSQCKDSESVMINGECVCRQGFFNVSGKCDQCPIGEIYMPQNQSCRECPKNMELVNGTCQCDKRSLLISQNQCIFCGDSFYPNSITKRCESCVANCQICFIFQQCVQCMPSHTGSTCQSCANGYVRKGGFCVLQNCGNKQRDDNEECDDGNQFDGDGCSNVCKVEVGYICNDTCEKIYERRNVKITSVGVFIRLKIETTLSTSISLIYLSGDPPLKTRIYPSPTISSQSIIFLDYGSSLPQPVLLTVLSVSTPKGIASQSFSLDLINKKIEVSQTPTPTQSRKEKEQTLNSLHEKQDILE